MWQEWTSADGHKLQQCATSEEAKREVSDKRTYGLKRSRGQYQDNGHQQQ